MQSPARGAAADLIRNLDAALSDMTAAAASAAEDAARARRNARAAGEVARRYGGAARSGKGNKGGARGNKSGRIGGGSGRKKRGANGADGGAGGDGYASGLLERTRERRAAARMAAEARQRREHPMLHSPRRLTSPLRASRGMREGGTPVKTSSEWLAEAGAQIRLATPDRVGSQFGGGPVETPSRIETDEAGTSAGGEGSAAMGGSPTARPFVTEDTSYARASASSPSAAAASHPPVEGKGSHGAMDASMADEFEDAVEHHPEDDAAGGEEWCGLFGAAETTPEKRGEPRPEPMAEEPPQPMAEEGAPPTEGYYTQQPQGQNVEYANRADQGPQSEQWQNNSEYYSQNQEQYYQDQPETTQTQQPHPKASPEHRQPIPQPMSPPKQKHSVPPTPPRGQPAPTARIEASHAEDVLTLSLELERARAQLASTTAQLEAARSEVATLKAGNETMGAELARVHSQLEAHNERSADRLGSLQERFDAEQLRAKAAEEDAALALELAKEAQGAKEECEMWLTRSLEEIDLWKGKCVGLEGRLQEMEHEREEPKKSVRFQDECPPSPVVSEDGGYEGEDASPAVGATPPPPPPPPPRPEWSTPQSDASGVAHLTSADGGIFSPTPSKTAVASGRAFLHRSSPSPRKDGVLSPHPRQRAAELLKRSAETRRLLRERLTPGRHALPLRPPVGPASASKVSDDAATFAERQGAACKAVGRAIRESGARLRLEGRWWTTPRLTDIEGMDAGPVIEDVAELESMVREYCGGVEGAIGKKKEKIDELLAFCDHLEKEVVSSRD